jgi:hypothetical protein
MHDEWLVDELHVLLDEPEVPAGPGVPEKDLVAVQDISRQNGGNGLIVKPVLYQH